MSALQDLIDAANPGTVVFSPGSPQERSPSVNFGASSSAPSVQTDSEKRRVGKRGGADRRAITSKAFAHHEPKMGDAAPFGESGLIAAGDIGFVQEITNPL